MLLALPMTPAAESPRVRILDPHWRVLIDAGCGESATLRRLFSELEGSDTIVHIVKAPPDERRSAAALQFVVSSGGMRFLRIRVAAGLPDRVTLSLVGHELQHALEVAREPSVIDQDTFVQFYRRVGIAIEDRHAHPSYDTVEAREVQRRVASELEYEARAREAGRSRSAAGRAGAR